METQPSTSARDGRVYLEPALSWSAIFAGALVGLAISVLLTLLAAGFGLTTGFGGLATHGSLVAFTPILGAAAIVIQVLSAALGGYLAGRLRHVWLGAHADEAHFRDTAHGLIAWALSTVAGVTLAAALLTPYFDNLTIPMLAASATLTPVDAQRAANIAAQSYLFAAIGMLLSAFTAAVAARLGGMRSEDMHARMFV